METLRVALGDIAEVTKLAGFEFTKHIEYLTDGEIIAIRGLNVKKGILDLTNIKRISNKASDLLPRSKLFKDDLVLTYTGTIGEVALITEDDRFHLAPNVAVVRPSGVNPYYLYCYMRSRVFKRDFETFSVGSTQKTVPMKNIRQVEIPLLPEKTQIEIGRIISLFDDKIELNQKMNQTLEDIAKAIFKSWFVDFDPVRAKVEGRPTGLPPEISDLFPDELVDSEIGEIPKGWGVAKLAEICETTDYVANGSFSTLKENVTKVDSFSGTEAVMLRFADFNKGWAGDFSFVTHDSYDFLSKSKVFCGDIVICNVGEVGAVFRAPNLGYDMTLGPNGVLCKNFESGIGLGREYFYFCMTEKTFTSRVEAISSGSVQTKFNKTDFRNLDVLVPHSELLAIVDPMFGQICQRLDVILDENRILSQLRDTLLLKLISGELRIPDAEKFLEEAGI